MSNIFEYLNWRGDIPFSVDPFNEVDNLVLSELAYVDLSGIFTESETLEDDSAPGMPIRQVCDRFWSLHTREEIDSSGILFKRAPYILRRLCSGERFGNMRLANYVDLVSARKNEQMSAVTCFLDDGTAYVAYRGTDDTLIGWKEDFSFSFRERTGGQKAAAAYLSDHFEKNDIPLRVGGHSKGGHFAVYASAFCAESVRDRIIAVYTNDGPGFSKRIVDDPLYQAILPKIKSYVPEEAVFGLLLECDYTHTTVMSSRKGIFQHDPLSWTVVRNRFKKAESISEGSLWVEEVIESWLEDMSNEERKEVVDIIFSTLDESGAENLSEFSTDQFHRILELSHAYLDMEQEDRQFLKEAAGRLFKRGMKTFSGEMKTRLLGLTGRKNEKK